MKDALVALTALLGCGGVWGLALAAYRLRGEAEHVRDLAEEGADRLREQMAASYPAASANGKLMIMPTAGTFTVNEARRVAGLPDVPWGNVIETPPPGTPVAAVATQPRPRPMTPQREAALLDAISTHYATSPTYTLADVEHDAERVMSGRQPERMRPPARPAGVAETY